MKVESLLFKWRETKKSFSNKVSLHDVDSCMFSFEVRRHIFTACWHTTALCAALRQQATLHPLNYIHGLFFLLHDCAAMRHGADTLAHYSKREHTTQSPVRQQSGLPETRKPEKRAVTAVTVMSRSRDNLGSGFRSRGEAERHGRLCHAAAAAAPGQRPPRPPRSAPGHDASRGGGGTERKEGPSCLCGPEQPVPPGPAEPCLGTASAALPAAPRSPSASAEETKVKSPLLGA